VKNREFTHALNVVKHDGAETLKDLVNDRVHTHEKKPASPPKPSGRKNISTPSANTTSRSASGRRARGKLISPSPWRCQRCAKGKVSRIILTRPAVEAGEALGFLPGDLYEKITPYLRPLHDALHDMLPAEEIQKHTERGTIEVAPLAYMRGRTLNNAFIILDEAQNSTTEQMLMFLTRLGHGSKAVITGDETQVDLPPHKNSGLIEAHRALKNTEGIAIVEFQARRGPASARAAHHRSLRGTSWQDENRMNVVIANRQRTKKINARLVKQFIGALFAELKSRKQNWASISLACGK
jgi:phosphate starvation-inducible PhoH-like protein